MAGLPFGISLYEPLGPQGVPHLVLPSFLQDNSQKNNHCGALMEDEVVQRVLPLANGKKRLPSSVRVLLQPLSLIHI